MNWANLITGTILLLLSGPVTLGSFYSQDGWQLMTGIMLFVLAAFVLHEEEE